MTTYTEKECPDCKQRLRFPNDVGGIVMVCPSCGKKFQSDFKIGVAKKHVPPGLFMTLFEMPLRLATLIGRLFKSR